MKLYKCKKCGNIIEMVENKGGMLTCCGDVMEDVVPNSNGAEEKHLPVCHIEDDYVIVDVGEVSHPMDSDHYIMYVMAEYSDSVVKYMFKPGEEIDVMFDYEKGMKVYAYCNLHGLWMVEI